MYKHLNEYQPLSTAEFARRRRRKKRRQAYSRVKRNTREIATGALKGAALGGAIHGVKDGAMMYTLSKRGGLSGKTALRAGGTVGLNSAKKALRGGAIAGGLGATASLVGSIGAKKYATKRKRRRRKRR